MIQDLIRDLSKIAGGLGAIEADTIAIFNKRDRTSGPRAISAGLAQQVAQEVTALSRFLSHLLISQGPGAPSKLRWLCYKIGYMANQAAGIIVAIQNGKRSLSDCLSSASYLLILILFFDKANAADLIKILAPGDCASLGRSPIHEVLHDLKNDGMTDLLRKIASHYEFEPVVNINLSRDQAIKPPKHLGDVAMVALYGPRSSSQYSIQIIDMIKVFMLYYHFVGCFSHYGDLLRAQSYALCMAGNYIKERRAQYRLEEQYLSPAYTALCMDALRDLFILQCIIRLDSEVPNYVVRSKVSMHILNAVKEVCCILYQPGMGSHDERVAIMNKFFRSVEDFVMPYYLIQDIPEPTLAGAHAHVSDEALDMRTAATLANAQARASDAVLDAGPSKRPRLL